MDVRRASYLCKCEVSGVRPLHMKHRLQKPLRAAVLQDGFFKTSWNASGNVQAPWVSMVTPTN